MSEPAVTIAKSLAAAHPHARLPCPACGVSVNAENLDRHLAKVHPDPVSAPPPWRGRGFLGVFPCRVAFAGNTFVLHHSLGLARRVVELPCALEAGALMTTRSDPILSSYDVNQRTETVRAGGYLRLVGSHAITIGCRQDTMFDAHWDRASLRAGDRRRGCDLVVPRVALVAIEYELALRGLLVPARRV